MEVVNIVGEGGAYVIINSVTRNGPSFNFRGRRHQGGVRGVRELPIQDTIQCKKILDK